MNKNLICEIWKDNLKKWDFIHEHFGFECDSCGLVPEIIYLAWLFDEKKNRRYLRYLCKNDLDKLLKIDGYLQNYFEKLAIETLCAFPMLDEIENLLFCAKHFLMRENYEVIKRT